MEWSEGHGVEEELAVYELQWQLTLLTGMLSLLTNP